MDKEYLMKIDSESNHFAYDEFEEYLIEKSVDTPFPQTEFQCNHFVSGSHPTFYRQVRQTLIELNSRKHSLEKIKISVRKCELEIEKIKNNIEKSEDDYERKLLEIELDDILLDLRVWHKKIKQCHIEMRYFLDWLKQNCGSVEEADKFFEQDDEEEHKYWIARMAKQTSIDIITSGRLGAGNLDAILQMPEEDQVKTLQLALSYAGAVNAGVDQLKLNSEKTVRFLRDEIPNNKFLEENSDVTSETKSLQSTDKSQTIS